MFSFLSVFVLGSVHDMCIVQLPLLYLMFVILRFYFGFILNEYLIMRH